MLMFFAISEGGEAVDRLNRPQNGVAVLGDEHGLSMVFGCGA
jgi:hypothetical protein